MEFALEGTISRNAPKRILHKAQWIEWRRWRGWRSCFEPMHRFVPADIAGTIPAGKILS